MDRLQPRPLGATVLRAASAGLRTWLRRRRLAWQSARYRWELDRVERALRRRQARTGDLAA